MISFSPELVMENLAWLQLNIPWFIFMTELAWVNSTCRDMLLAKYASLAKACRLSRWLRKIQCSPAGMLLLVAVFNKIYIAGLLQSGLYWLFFPTFESIYVFFFFCHQEYEHLQKQGQMVKLDWKRIFRFLGWCSKNPVVSAVLQSHVRWRSLS